MSEKKRKNPEFLKIEENASKKRMGKTQMRPKNANSNKISIILAREELVVQRLTSEMSGKTPKYTAIGPREFVPYLADDLTIGCIKEACVAHFGKNDRHLASSECDILASERGPSCSHVEQIPNVSLIHIRFVSKATSLLLRTSLLLQPVFKKAAVSKHIPIQDKPDSVIVSSSTSSPSPVITPSLSLFSMLKVGKLVKDKREFKEICLEKFDLDTMSWEFIGPIKFFIEDEIFGTGAFRNVHKLETSDKRFTGSWLIKKFNETAIQTITIGFKQTLEEHARKVVQMSSLAAHFALKLGEINVPKFKYVDTLYGRITDSDEYVTIEQEINGHFEKYLNNDGCCYSNKSIMVEKAECLAHFTFMKSEEQLLLTDIQGCGFVLTDPEIASSEISQEKEIMFCVGNYCRKAIKNFGLSHECNTWCKAAGLVSIDKSKYQSYDDSVDFNFLDNQE